MEGGKVTMATERLDLEAIVATVPSGDPGWSGAPENTVIGHVHLRVGDPRQEQVWWQDAVGLDTMSTYGPSAVFLSSGGYHHHIGANSWQSRGAGRRDPSRAGLGWVEMRSSTAPNDARLEDPWGTEIRIIPGKPG